MALVTGLVPVLAAQPGCLGYGPRACDALYERCDTPAAPDGVTTIRDFRQNDRRARPIVGDPVRVRNAVVTAIDDHVEGPRGSTGDAWVQERVLDPTFSGCAPHPEGGVVCGMQLFAPTIIPAGSQLVPGDIVSINGGRYDEFDCTPCCQPPRDPCLFSDGRTLPELSLTSVERVGTTRPPEPIPVSLAQIGDGGDRYVGVLVRLTDEITLPAPDARGEFRLGNGVNLTTQIGPLLDPMTGEPLAAGARLRNLAGIVSYFYGTKLLVRGPEDYTLVR